MSTTTPSATEMTQEAASKDVREVALELNNIKNAMKKISIVENGNDNGGEENVFKVTALKVCLCECECECMICTFVYARLNEYCCAVYYSSRYLFVTCYLCITIYDG